MAKDKKKSMVYGDAAEAAAKAATAFGGKSVALPDGTSFMPMKDEKEYRFRFAPFVVGQGNPEQPPGTVWYTRKYFAHARIGMGDDGKGGDTYCCNRRVFGTPCPVCEYSAKLRSTPNADPAVIDALKVKERQLFLVRDGDDKGKGWRILDLSYHALGKQLEAKLKASRNVNRDDDEVEQYPFKHFFYLQGGAVVRILMEDPKLKFKFLQAKNIEITPTKEALPDDFLDTAPCLDDLLIETPYDVLKKVLFEGHADSQDDDDDEPVKKPVSKAPAKKPAPVEDDDDSDEMPMPPKKKAKAAPVEEEEDTEEEEAASDGTIKVGSKVFFDYKGKAVTGVVKKINAETDMASVKSELRDPPHSVDLDELTLVTDEEEEEEEDEPVAPKKAAKAKAKPAPVEDDDDEEEEEAELVLDEEEEEEEEEDDEPVAPKKKGKEPTRSTSKPSKSRAFNQDDGDDDDFAVDDDDDEPVAPKKTPKK